MHLSVQRIRDGRSFTHLCLLLYIIHSLIGNEDWCSFSSSNLKNTLKHNAITSTQNNAALNIPPGKRPLFFFFFFLNLVPTGGSSFIIDEISANEIKKRHLYDTIILPETEKFNTVNASKYIAESSAWFGRHSCFSHKIWSNSWSILVSYLSRYYSKSHDKLHNFTCDIRLHTSSLWIFDRFSWQ